MTKEIKTDLLLSGSTFEEFTKTEKEHIDYVENSVLKVKKNEKVKII